jgi:hypothetical protein
LNDYVLNDKILVPRSLKQAQMSKPIVFWHNKNRDHIMNAPGPDITPPSGYQRIECRHAHEVDTWSSRLRAQEKRIRDMSDEERYQYEDRLRHDMIEELRRNLAASNDETNRLFMQAAITHAEQQRERIRPVHIQRETYQACEAEEGVAS